MNKYVSVTEYANLCKAERQTIYDRIESGTIKPTKLKGIKGIVIDTDKYPPQPPQKTGRPTIEEQLKKLQKV